MAPYPWFVFLEKFKPAHYHISQHHTTRFYRPRSQTAGYCRVLRLWAEKLRADDALEWSGLHSGAGIQL